MLSEEATNTNFIVFDLTQSGLEQTLTITPPMQFFKVEITHYICQFIFSDICVFWFFFLCLTGIVIKRVSVCCLMPIQQYHGENKLIINEMMMRSALL